MTGNSKLPEIRGEAFTKAREKLGLSIKELGALACLSKSQIEQIENGEMKSFYGAQIKVTAAKKVAKLLSLSDAEAFDGLRAETVQSPLENIEAPANINIKIKPVEKSAPVKEAPTKTQAPLETIDPPKVLVLSDKKEPTGKNEPQTIPFTSVESKSKSAPRKKWFLGFSLVVGVLFVVVNLRPLFFEDKPVAVMVVKEELVEPAPASVSNPTADQTVPPSVAGAAAPVTTTTTTPALAPITAAASSDPSLVCPVEDASVNYKPEVARKSGDMVYVQAKSKQVVCVIDGSGKTQNKLLEAGAGTSFYGKPPFKVLTAGLAQVDVYFQGYKARIENPNSKTLVLDITEVVAPPPADPTDSRLR